MRADYKDFTQDPSGFVLLADFVPNIIQEIRYYSTYNFIGERIDGYEEPCALLTIEAARALKSVSSELFVQGYRLKVFDAYRPASAVKHFVLWGIEDQDIRMKPYFYPDLEKQDLFYFLSFSIIYYYIRTFDYSYRTFFYYIFPFTTIT